MIEVFALMVSLAPTKKKSRAALSAMVALLARKPQAQKKNKKHMNLLSLIHGGR